MPSLLWQNILISTSLWDKAMKQEQAGPDLTIQHKNTHIGWDRSCMKGNQPVQTELASQMTQMPQSRNLRQWPHHSRTELILRTTTRTVCPLPRNREMGGKQHHDQTNIAGKAKKWDVGLLPSEHAINEYTYRPRTRSYVGNIGSDTGRYWPCTRSYSVSRSYLLNRCSGQSTVSACTSESEQS